MPNDHLELAIMIGFIVGWGAYCQVQASLRRYRDHWYARGHTDGVEDTIRAARVCGEEEIVRRGQMLLG